MADLSGDKFLVREFQHEGDLCQIYLGKPQPIAENGDSTCSYSIVLRGRVITREATGVDGMQALVLAMVRIGSLLYSNRIVDTSQMFWLDPDRVGYLGLPVLKADRDLIPSEPQMTILL